MPFPFLFPRPRRLAAWCVASSSAFALALSGCSSAPTTTTAASGTASASPLSTALDPQYDGPDKPYFATLPPPTVVPGISFKVGFLTLNGGQPVLLAMQNAAQAEVQQLGGTFIAKDASVNPQTQVSQINELINDKVDVIIGDPVVADALSPSVTAAKQAGIPFIALGVPTDETKPFIPDAVTGVVQSYDYIVYRTMKALAQEHPGATFATMGLALPVDALTFMNARMKYWGESFGLKFLGEVDASNDTPAGYGPATDTILARYPNVGIIVTYNDESAVAAATAVAASGKDVKVATPNSGQSLGRDALAAHRLDLVYRTPWEDLGTQSAIAAYDVVSKQHLPLPRIINVPSYIVTPADVDEARWIQ